MLSANSRSCDLLRLQRVADADVVLDVGHHGERAADASAELAVREQRDAHPAQLAGRLALAPLVGDRRAGKRTLDVALHFGERVGRQHVAQRVAEQVVRGHADPVAERLVGEAQLQLAVEIEDRQPDAVGDEPQPVLALAGLELEPLEVVDVGVGDEKAADVALRRAVRVIVDADPDRRPPRRDQLPLVDRPLAVERGVDVGVVELVDVAAEDFDDLVADNLVLPLAQPVQERLVGEAVALVAIDVGERQAKRVELALRKRGQRIPLERLLPTVADGRARGGSANVAAPWRGIRLVGGRPCSRPRRATRPRVWRSERLPASRVQRQVAMASGRTKARIAPVDSPERAAARSAGSPAENRGGNRRPASAKLRFPGRWIAAVTIRVTKQRPAAHYARTHGTVLRRHPASRVAPFQDTHAARP